jgi:hypothetical protein
MWSLLLLEINVLPYGREILPRPSVTSLNLASKEQETLREVSAVVNRLLSLDEKSSKIQRKALRQRQVEKISKIVEDLAEKTRIGEDEIRNYPARYEGKEVEIYFFLHSDWPDRAGYGTSFVATSSRKRVEAIMMRGRGI